MNAAMCLKWVKKYGKSKHDRTTTEHVIEWVIDIALECAQGDDVVICEDARKYAIKHLDL